MQLTPHPPDFPSCTPRPGLRTLWAQDSKREIDIEHGTNYYRDSSILDLQFYILPNDK